jgi:hypothetical protein
MYEKFREPYTYYIHHTHVYIYIYSRISLHQRPQTSIIQAGIYFMIGQNHSY